MSIFVSVYILTNLMGMLDNLVIHSLQGYELYCIASHCVVILPSQEVLEELKRHKSSKTVALLHFFQHSQMPQIVQFLFCNDVGD